MASLPRIRQFVQKFSSQDNEKLNPLYKMLKAEVPIKITFERKKTFESVNKALSDVCQLAVKQRIPGKKFVFMTDAVFKNAC